MRSPRLRSAFRVDGGPNRPDVFRSRTAAPADNSYAMLNELLRIRRHVFRRAQVDVAAFDVPWLACVGLHGQFSGSRLLQALHDVEHCLRTHAAIQSDDVRSPLIQAAGEYLWWRAFGTVSVVFYRHLNDEWVIRTDITYGANRGVDFVQIEKCFENEQVHAAFG